MFRVKICGITRAADATAAVECGADAVGINFCRSSPRYVEPEKAARIVDAVGGKALVLGVFVDEPPESVEAIVRSLKLDAVQLSGDEPAAVASRLPFRLVKAVRVTPGADLSAWGRYPAEALLLDAHMPGSYGGTGLTLEWSSLPAAVSTMRGPGEEPVRWLLAGGLTPENVFGAIVAARPSGVDVASGVESAPGIKDPRKVALFIQKAKEGLSIART
ncbi:MAG TPA: phosphoribosylanthranilate isomerase [Candidatus Deferrimicrobiaceae bacterium]